MGTQGALNHLELAATVNFVDTTQRNTITVALATTKMRKDLTTLYVTLRALVSTSPLRCHPNNLKRVMIPKQTLLAYIYCVFILVEFSLPAPLRLCVCSD